MLKLIGKKIFTKITYLAYRPNAKKNLLYQKIIQFWKCKENVC